MSPRPGGEADKFGNRYEGAWTGPARLTCTQGRLQTARTSEPGQDFPQLRELRVRTIGLRQGTLLVTGPPAAGTVLKLDLDGLRFNV